jgi:hypothetical protein
MSTKGRSRHREIRHLHFFKRLARHMPIQPADIAQPPMPLVVQDAHIGGIRAAGEMTGIPHIVADEAVDMRDFCWRREKERHRWSASRR